MHALARKQILAVGFLLVAGPLGLRAQTEREVPTIEPTLTRLFGSDSLNMWNPSTQAALSPDGRWVVFNSVELGDRMNMWIASVEGGQVIRLTEGPYYHGQAQWFPSGDRIVFRSNRMSRNGADQYHVMSLAIDPETGQPRGTPRQITLETTHGNGYSLSPDGKWIAYTTRREHGGPPISRVRGLTIRVLPSNGGTARTVADRDILFHPTWAPDGRGLYFVTREDGSFEFGPDSTATAILMHVSIEDGIAEEVFRWPATEASSVEISRDGRYVYRGVSDGEYELATIEGRALARFKLPKRMSLAGKDRDGATLLARLQNTAAPLRVLPVAGGPGRQLNEIRAYDSPIGWTGDSKQVLFRTQLDGEEIMLLAPVDGGAMRQVPIADKLLGNFVPVLDDKHLLYVAAGGEDTTPAMKILDIETGRAREVSRSLWLDYVRYNPLRAADRFLYAEVHGDRYELRSVGPEGRPRLLWSFSPEEFPEGVAVHGDRIVFTRQSGDETSLYVAVVGETEVRRILTRPGRTSLGGMWGPVWSPDGTVLALAHSPLGAEVHDVMLVEVSESGELVGEPRVLTLDDGPSWWAYLQWLPDQSGFLVWGMGAETTLDTDIWLISLDPDVDPVPLTKDDPHSVWNFSLSPDGKYVAYSSEIPLGGSIWKVELGEIPEPTRH